MFIVTDLVSLTALNISESGLYLNFLFQTKLMHALLEKLPEFSADE